MHQGLALGPFLFVMVMESLRNEVRQEPPWSMMFAEGIVMSGELLADTHDLNELSCHGCFTQLDKI